MHGRAAYVFWNEAVGGGVWVAGSSQARTAGTHSTSHRIRMEAEAAAPRPPPILGGARLPPPLPARPAPVVIPPGMPLQFIYAIMTEQGLNYVPVIKQHGPLEGIVTR
jgi:hypothetical protein